MNRVLVANGQLVHINRHHYEIEDNPRSAILFEAGNMGNPGANPFKIGTGPDGFVDLGGGTVHG